MKLTIGIIILAVLCIGCADDAPTAYSSESQYYVPCQPIPEHSEQFGVQTNHALQDSLCQSVER